MNRIKYVILHKITILIWKVREMKGKIRHFLINYILLFHVISFKFNVLHPRISQSHYATKKVRFFKPSKIVLDNCCFFLHGSPPPTLRNIFSRGNRWKSVRAKLGEHGRCCKRSYFNSFNFFTTNTRALGCAFP